MREEIAKRQRIIEKLEAEHARILRDGEKERNEVDSELAAKFASLQKENADVERKALEDKQQRKRDFEGRLKQLDDELAEETSLKARLVSSLREELQKVEKDNKEEVEKLEKEIESLDQSRRKRIEELTQEIERTSAGRVQEENNLNDEYELLVRDLESRLTSLQRDNLLEMADKEKLLRELRRRRAAKLEKRRKELEEQESREKKEFDAVQQLHEKELGEFRLRCETELKGLSDKCSGLEEDIEIQSSRFKRLISDEEREFQEKLKDLEDTLASENNLKRREMREIEAVRIREVEELEHNIFLLNKEFEGRGAKLEDLERIQELTDLIEDRKEGLAKVMAEVKKYQSELMSKETQINKVFTNKRRVQVLSALERRATRDQIISKAAEISPRRLPKIEK
jgi:DNA repair exonuclease SbcCD ATPase subunit